MKDKRPDRIRVSELIIGVLTQKILVRQALEVFPTDKSDLSLQCVWHALVHYEADEDLRARDVAYKEEQDEFLEFLASLLSEGQDLPRDIIAGYKDFYEEAPLSDEKGFKGWIKSLFRFINV